jgi:hypothetical protein
LKVGCHTGISWARVWDMITGELFDNIGDSRTAGDGVAAITIGVEGEAREWMNEYSNEAALDPLGEQSMASSRKNKSNLLHSYQTQPRYLSYAKGS